jgi:hypothetical protein
MTPLSWCTQVVECHEQPHRNWVHTCGDQHRHCRSVPSHYYWIVTIELQVLLEQY